MKRLPRLPRSNWLLSLLSLAAFLAAGLGLQAARSQVSDGCFAETGYCISGRIREVWQGSGGLRAFGYPLTPMQEEVIEGQTRVVQWFERARLEWHPSQAAPYDVQLGRLSSELLARRGQNWQQFARPAAHGDCRMFSETGYAVCDEFLAAWRSVGMNLDGDGLASEFESLALFGLPLSGLRAERLSDGRMRVVQWFERARFELHPDQPAPYRVLFGLLGSELEPVAGTPWVPPPTPTPPPFVPPPPPGPLPTRLVIPAIGLDRSIIAVGMRGIELEVPDLDIGWFNQSATPRQGENVVLWAHVLPFSYAPNATPPFARMKELPIGAEITLYDAVGQAHRYRVIEQITALPNEADYIFPRGRELLTMVSCIGEQVINPGGTVDMTHRLITIAEPVQ
jgi:sortase (surface protein transpeptidase)